jgi:hypothetical protein
MPGNATRPFSIKLLAQWQPEADAHRARKEDVKSGTFASAVACFATAPRKASAAA